jgi:hypothetical protein
MPRPSLPRWELKYSRQPEGSKAGPVSSEATVGIEVQVVEDA